MALSGNTLPVGTRVLMTIGMPRACFLNRVKHRSREATQTKPGNYQTLNCAITEHRSDHAAVCTRVTHHNIDVAKLRFGINRDRLTSQRRTIEAHALHVDNS